MALPKGFCNTLEYFEEVVRLLHNHKLLFYRTNNEIFKYEIVDSFSIEWANFFKDFMQMDKLCDLGLGIEIPNAPQSLNKFIQQINRLKPQYEILSNRISIETSTGLGLKKQHEISLLAPLILNHCKVNNISYIIDIGCGLGYLTKLLKEHNMNVMGIDGNPKLVQTARKKYPDIAFEHLFVTTESSEIIIVLLKKHFKEFNEHSRNVCLVALHACADLTVDMLKLFLTMHSLKGAIVMPCCYHRMKYVEGRQEFINFPLSKHLADTINMIDDVDKNEDSRFLNGSFLRLACQRANWMNQTTEQITLQIKNIMYRNLLQVVVDEGNFKVQRRRRKTGSNHGDYNINNFLTNLQSSYNITSNVSSRVVSITDEEYELIKAAIQENYNSIYRHKEPLIGAFVALQNLIQSVCENLVLLDRCAFINQTGGAQCVTVKVTDECISPRCFALVTTKHSEATDAS